MPVILIELPLLALHSIFSDSIVRFIVAAPDVLRLMFSFRMVLIVVIEEELEARNVSIRGILTLTFFDSIFIKEL
jgi:hypothetical protein